jgi:hypothetical protein
VAKAIARLTVLLKFLFIEVLNVSCNRLTALPRGFGSFSAILILDLSNNKLTELTPQIGLLATLKELHVSYNELESLPVELGRLANLEILVSAKHKAPLLAHLVILFAPGRNIQSSAIAARRACQHGVAVAHRRDAQRHRNAAARAR